MSHGYRSVHWTPFKKRFDAWMLAGVAVIGPFVKVAVHQFNGQCCLSRACGKR